ncbi:MAG: biotin-dependent carboxyltransferase family protein, partial [Nocardioidaceae bacterium]
MGGAISLEVRASGPLALVEDLGRPGHAALGVGPSGAADRASLRLANRLLGNPEGAAAIEVALGGLEIVVRGGDLWVGVTGAPAPISVADVPSGRNGVVLLRDGDRLSLGVPEYGLRTYVAVRGGIEAAEALGSRSTDVLSGIGPDPLAEGDVLAVGEASGALPSVDVVPDPTAGRGGTVDLRAVRGPRDDWVTDA